MSKREGASGPLVNNCDWGDIWCGTSPAGCIDNVPVFKFTHSRHMFKQLLRFSSSIPIACDDSLVSRFQRHELHLPQLCDLLAFWAREACLSSQCLCWRQKTPLAPLARSTQGCSLLGDRAWSRIKKDGQAQPIVLSAPNP